MNKLFVIIMLALSACGSESPKVIDGMGPAGSKSFSIINGEPAGDLLEHGAVVGLHRLTKKYGGAIYLYPFCSGVLISKNVVLTAAHCLDKASSSSPTTPLKSGELAIYVGDAPAALDADGGYDLFNGLNYVEDLLIYSEYNKFTLANDIGIIRLKADVTSVLPVNHMTPTNGFTETDVGVLTMNIVGFGQNELGDFGVKLAATTVLSAILSESLIEHVYLSHETIICFGDSGGANLITRDGGLTYLVGGIASWVSWPYCENSAAHSRVDYFNTFIEDFLNPVDIPLVCEDLQLGDPCLTSSDCCSGKCKGKSGSKTCK